MSTHTNYLKLPCAVELGSPAAECAHFGICSMEVIPPEQWDTFQPRHIRQVKAMVSMNPCGQLRISFPFEGMRKDTQRVFFPPEGFKIDSSRTLPSSIVEALNLPSHTRIQPSFYPFEWHPSGLDILVSLLAEEQALAIAA